MSDKLAGLRAPFPAHQISKLPKPTKQQTEEVRANFKKGIRCQVCGTWHHPDVVHLDYVGHAALTDRLLDVDPAWSWEPLALREDGTPVVDGDGGMWIKLTVCGVTRLGYGDAQGKTGGNATKERIGDALRNAAMRFGAALDLWHKGDLHIEEETPEPTKAQDGPKAPITPTGGAWDGMTGEQQQNLERIAMDVISYLSKARDLDAAERIAAAELDTDEKVALWTRFDSKQRSALKKAMAPKETEPA